MQAAFQNAHHGTRRNVKVVFLPPFPDSPNRRPETARVSDSKANYKFTLSISHVNKTQAAGPKSDFPKSERISTKLSYNEPPAGRLAFARSLIDE
jgi:hypothetical protein